MSRLQGAATLTCARLATKEKLKVTATKMLAKLALPMNVREDGSVDRMRKWSVPSQPIRDKHVSAKLRWRLDFGARRYTTTAKAPSRETAIR
jgi:hypothetical protein